MSATMNAMIEQFEATMPSIEEDECTECFNVGYVVVMDEELGEVHTGCFTCWARSLDVRMQEEEQLRQEEATRALEEEFA
jgi:hypothetical protein